MKQTIEIEVPDGKKAIWKGNKVIFKDIKPRFDPKTLKAFDKVLVRNDKDYAWYINIYSHKNNHDKNYPYNCIMSYFKYCIPYNDDTKHLVGTTEEAPELYKYWED